MNNNTVIITGTGFRHNENFNSSENIFTSENVKINIGTATAKILAQKGYNIILISRTIEKLEIIRKDILMLFPNITVAIYPIDILNEESCHQFFKNLSNESNYYYVHSAGLSTGSYDLKDDNPYLPIEEIPVDLPSLEFTTVVKSLLIMMKGLLPFFSNQLLSKVVVINSMSGIRSYPLGYSHSSAKGGLHNAVRALSLELSKRNILFSEIMPGIVDTGLYDNNAVVKSVRRIGKEFGYNYDTSDIPKMNPLCVADVVYTCLVSEANILSINMVSQGQWTHQNS
ncbi:MAG: SDR family NAD(P)-dependent oxidoreductase [Chitinophagales bacterium]|nr:SDR family NAD(P)-dependent oxidoreductase [Chitinophagales bacterium]